MSYITCKFYEGFAASFENFTKCNTKYNINLRVNVNKTASGIKPLS